MSSADAFLAALRARHHAPRSLDNQLLYIPALGAMFMGISKNACSLLKSELYRMGGGAERPPERSPHNRHTMGFIGPADAPAEQFVDWLFSREVPKFAFLRDPLARLRSCYRNRLHHLGLEPYDNAASSRANQVMRRQAVLVAGGRHRVSYAAAQVGPLSFEDFVHALDHQHPWEMDQHWAPQALLLRLGDIRYDFLGRVERLDEDLPRLARRLGAHGDYRFDGRRLNASAGAVAGDDGISEAARERVRAIYAEDYALLDSLDGETGA